MLRFMMIYSNATSTLIHQTRPGSRISLSTGRGKGNCIYAQSRTCVHAQSLGMPLARMKSHLAVAVLEEAMRKRGEPKGVIVHSDRGVQFRSRKFRAALKAYNARGPMGGVGACGDNAAMESFFALVQKNVPGCKSWVTRRGLSTRSHHWIERTYRRKGRQRALGKLTPIECETIMEPAVSLAA